MNFIVRFYVFIIIIFIFISIKSQDNKTKHFLPDTHVTSLKSNISMNITDWINSNHQDLSLIIWIRLESCSVCKENLFNSLSKIQPSSNSCILLSPSAIAVNILKIKTIKNKYKWDYYEIDKKDYKDKFWNGLDDYVIFIVNKEYEIISKIVITKNFNEKEIEKEIRNDLLEVIK